MIPSPKIIIDKKTKLKSKRGPIKQDEIHS